MVAFVDLYRIAQCDDWSDSRLALDSRRVRDSSPGVTDGRDRTGAEYHHCGMPLVWLSGVSLILIVVLCAGNGGAGQDLSLVESVSRGHLPADRRMRAARSKDKIEWIEWIEWIAIPTVSSTPATNGGRV